VVKQGLVLILCTSRNKKCYENDARHKYGQILQKSRSHLKILGAGRVTCSKSHTAKPQIWDIVKKKWGILAVRVCAFPGLWNVTHSLRVSQTKLVTEKDMILATCKNPKTSQVKFTQHNSQTTITACDSGSDHTRTHATSRRILTTDAPVHFGFPLTIIVPSMLHMRSYTSWSNEQCAH
jgi:hypothetical protein